MGLVRASVHSLEDSKFQSKRYNVVTKNKLLGRIPPGETSIAAILPAGSILAGISREPLTI